MAFIPPNPNGQATSANSAPVTIASDQSAVSTLLSGINPTPQSVSALNGDLLPSTDVTNYRSFSIQVTGVFSGTYTFQGSNDNFASANSTFTMQVLQANSNGGIVGSSGTTNIVWKGAVNYRYIRVRMTSYTSGTATGTTTISTAPLDSFYNFSSVSGTVTATPPNATATGSITASAQTINLGTNLIGGGGYGVVTVSGTYAGVSFTLSSSTNNGTLVYPVPIYDTNAGVWLKPGTTITPGTNVTNAYYVPIAPYANQAKLISTAYTSGTMTVGFGASTNGQPGSTMTQDNSTGLTGVAIPTSASYFAAKDASGLLQGVTTSSAAAATTGTSLLGAGVLGFDGTNYQRVKTDTTGIIAAALTPSTTGGPTVLYTGSIGATVTAVKASAGQIYSWEIFNANATAVYVQFFNLAVGSVTLGTTAPYASIGIPAGGGSTVSYSNGKAFSTAISVAVTTTRAGLTAPTSTVDLNFWGI